MNSDNREMKANTRSKDHDGKPASCLSAVLTVDIPGSSKKGCRNSEENASVAITIALNNKEVP